METVIPKEEKIRMLINKALPFLNFWFSGCTGYVEIRLHPNELLKERDRAGVGQRVFTFSMYIPPFDVYGRTHIEKGQDPDGKKWIIFINPWGWKEWENLYNYNQLGYNIYFGVCPRFRILPARYKKDIPELGIKKGEIIYDRKTGEAKPGSGTAEDVREIPGIYFDIDKKDFHEGIIPETYKLFYPSVVNFTGNGIHGFIKYATPLILQEPMAEIIPVNQIGEFLGGDKVGDTPRIMRLPGTYNVKNIKGNETPSLLCDTIDFSEKMFTPEEIDELFKKIESGEFGEPLGFKGGQKEIEYWNSEEDKVKKTTQNYSASSVVSGTRKKAGGNGKKSGSKRTPDEYEKIILSGSLAGSRNTDLTSLTGYYRTAKKMSKEFFTQIIAPAFCQNCSPPLDWNEALTVIDSVYSYPDPEQESEPEESVEDENTSDLIPLHTIEPRAEDYPGYSFPDISNIFEYIEETSDRRIIAQAPTGTGKTYNIIKSVINLFSK